MRRLKTGICGNYGAGNLGDELILKNLKKMVGRVFGDPEITVFGKYMFFPFGLRSLLRSIFDFSMWKKPFSALRSCDIFILGGGGLFSDEEGFFVSLFWVFQGIWAVWMKKPVVCLGIGIGRLNWFNKAVVKWFLKRAKLVTLRDEKSYLLVKEQMRIDCYKTGDLALLYDELNSTNSSQIPNPQSQNYMVINARPFHGANENLYTNLAQLCDFAIEVLGLNIRLLPLSNDVVDDTSVLNKIFEQARGKQFITIEQYTDDFEQIIGLLKNAEFAVCMRLHCGILSLIAGTPFIPLVYMDKVKDFWSDFAQIKPLDISQIQPDQLMELFKKILACIYHNNFLLV